MITLLSLQQKDANLRKKKAILHNRDQSKNKEFKIFQEIAFINFEQKTKKELLNSLLLMNIYENQEIKKISEKNNLKTLSLEPIINKDSEGNPSKITIKIKFNGNTELIKIAPDYAYVECDNNPDPRPYEPRFTMEIDTLKNELIYAYKFNQESLKEMKQYADDIIEWVTETKNTINEKVIKYNEGLNSFIETSLHQLKTSNKEKIEGINGIISNLK